VKRRAFKVFVFLLAGAIINVVVALLIWFFAPRPERGTFAAVEQWKNTEVAFADLAAWRQFSKANWPSEPTSAARQSKWGLRFRRTIAVENGFDVKGLATEEWRERALARRFFEVENVQCGWPCMLLSISQAIETSGLPPTHAVRRGGLKVGSYSIPSTVFWPGLAINTIFYAAIVYALFALPGAYRRRRRIKRGLCVRCAYPVGVGQRCSECGAPVG
jgi:hypothetical protein